MPFDKGSAAMGFEIKEIKRQRRAVKVTHPPAGGGNFTSGAASQVQWSDSVMKRLHPPSHKATVDKQARLPGIGEDVKKTFGFEWRAFAIAADAARRKRREEALRLRSPFLPQAKMVGDEGLEPPTFTV